MASFDFKLFKEAIFNKNEVSEILSKDIIINNEVSLALSNVYMFLSILFRYPNENVYNELFANFNKFELFFEEYIAKMPELPYREDLETEYVSLFVTNKGGVPAPLYSSVYTDEERLVLRDSTVKLKEMMFEAGFKINEDLKEIEDNLYIMLEFISSLIKQLSENEYCKKEIIDKLNIIFDVTDNYISPMIPEFTNKISEYAKIDFYKQIADLLSNFIEDRDNLFFEMIEIK
jgi:TorA maturation chaperone TorD